MAEPDYKTLRLSLASPVPWTSDKPSSVKTVRSAIIAAAIDIWGNEDDAMNWLTTPHVELGGVAPADLLDTPAGERRVENLLSALENGFPV